MVDAMRSWHHHPVVLPVAYYCIFQLGFQTGTTRTYVHSLLGSAFFGAYASKITIVKLKRFPVLVLPVGGRRRLHGAARDLVDERALALSARGRGSVASGRWSSRSPTSSV